MIKYGEYSSKVRKLVPSALIFLSGVGSIYIAELIITRYGDAETVSRWAVLKSFMMIASTVAMFGINSLIFREPSATRILLKVGIVQVLIVSVLAGVFGVYMGWAPSMLIGASVVAGYALTNFAFQWLRSEQRLTESYIANNGWRILFLIGILGIFIYSHIDPGEILLVAFVLGGISVLALIKRPAPRMEKKSHHNDIQSILDIYKVGASFFLTNIVLAISAHGENIVVHYLGGNEDVSMYYRGLVVYLFPSVIVNQYLVAVFGVWIRENEKTFNRLIKQYARIVGFALVLFLWPLLFLGGRILEQVFYGEATTPLALAMLLSLGACVRFYYILPSSYVGVMANRKQLFHVSLWYMASALFLLVLPPIFVFLGISTVIAVALASIINWAFRSLVGTNIIRERIRMQTGSGESA